jgi:hypothetical protein
VLFDFLVLQIGRPRLPRAEGDVGMLRPGARQGHAPDAVLVTGHSSWEGVL